MLNPSIADHEIDDPTIKRCISFSKSNGFGGFYTVNLFSYRSTDKSQIRKVEKPIGEKTNDYILQYAKKCPTIIGAWGNDGQYRGEVGRSEEALKR
jgi:hypothetical protein